MLSNRSDMDGLKASYIMHVSADTSTPPCLKILRGAESTAGYCSALFIGDRSYNIHTYIPQESTHTQHTHAHTADRAGLDHALMNENLEHIFENQNMLGLLFSIYLSILPNFQSYREKEA